LGCLYHGLEILGDYNGWDYGRKGGCDLAAREQNFDSVLAALPDCVAIFLRAKLLLDDAFKNEGK